MTPLEAAEEMRRLSGLLDKGIDALRRESRHYAEAEDAYRMAHATAYVAADGPAHLRKARADLATSAERVATSAERVESHLADGMRQAALEAVRSRRAQVSAVQSLLNAYRAEAEFAATGPRGTA